MTRALCSLDLLDVPSTRVASPQAPGWWARILPSNVRAPEIQARVASSRRFSLAPSLDDDSIQQRASVASKSQIARVTRTDFRETGATPSQRKQ
ncbi:hypothetical protein MTO96_047928 [Rhipicephalus appendiculatus]